MKVLDKQTAFDLTKLLIFIVVTTIATGLLVVTIGNITFSGSKEYKAEFVDATGVVKGDDIRIAGVKVGSVSDVQVIDRTRALVTFDVKDDAAVTGATNAEIRFRNLVGQRYITLTRGIGDTQALPEGSTIPVEKTSPALDLTVLFNGFKPLFQALTPSDLNKLSFEVIQVFQGEGGTLEGLLDHTASVTQTLASRDQVIGDLIDNLNEVLDHLVDGIREPFVDDIRELRETAGNLDENKAELDRALQVLPIKLQKVGRTAIYGSWFNFYLCDYTGQIRVGGQTLKIPTQHTGSERCDLP